MSTELATRDDDRAIATRGAARSAIALSPDQTEWTPAQVAALRQLGIEDAPEGDLQVFHHVCQTTGLDPFRKQIYMIGRRTKVKHWDEQQKRQVEDWITKYTIQTGIDGFRWNGQRAAKREGTAIRVDGPYWQGADGGGWQDVWLSSQPPAAAKFVIFRDGEAHTGIAMYREFVQTIPGSNAPNSMWAKMPANQLAKCAEAQAWRRAYPDDFSGMQLEDAAQIIDPNGEPVRATAQRMDQPGYPGARVGSPAAIQQWPAEQPANEDQADNGSAPVVSEPPTENPESDSGQAPRKSTRTQQNHISKQLEVLGATGKPEKLAYLKVFFDRELASVAELTHAEADEVIDEVDRQVAAKSQQDGADTIGEAVIVTPAEQTEAGDQ